MGREFERRRHSFVNSVQPRQASGHVLRFDIGPGCSNRGRPGRPGGPGGNAIFIIDFNKPGDKGDRVDADAPITLPEDFNGQISLGRCFFPGNACQGINVKFQNNHSEVSLSAATGNPHPFKVTLDGAPSEMVCEGDECIDGTKQPGILASELPNAGMKISFCPSIAAENPTSPPPAAAPPAAAPPVAVPSSTVPLSPEGSIIAPTETSPLKSVIGSPQTAIPTDLSTPSKDKPVSPPIQQNSGDIAAIAGGTVAGVVVLLGLFLIFIIVRRRRRRPDPGVFEVQTPFTIANHPNGRNLPPLATVNTSMEEQDPIPPLDQLQPYVADDEEKAPTFFDDFIQGEKDRFANIVSAYSPSPSMENSSTTITPPKRVSPKRVPPPKLVDDSPTAL